MTFALDVWHAGSPGRYRRWNSSVKFIATGGKMLLDVTLDEGVLVLEFWQSLLSLHWRNCSQNSCITLRPLKLSRCHMGHEVWRVDVCASAMTACLLMPQKYSHLLACSHLGQHRLYMLQSSSTMWALAQVFLPLGSMRGPGLLETAQSISSPDKIQDSQVCFGFMFIVFSFCLLVHFYCFCCARFILFITLLSDCLCWMECSTLTRSVER